MMCILALHDPMLCSSRPRSASSKFPLAFQALPALPINDMVQTALLPFYINK